MGLVDTFFNLRVLGQTWPLLLRACGSPSCSVSPASCSASPAGCAGALAALRPEGRCAAAAAGYIDVFRAIPLLVLLVVIYYALPFVGIRLTSFAAATAALSLVSSAYAAEIFRAGIEAVPSGQFEAARAIGLHWWPMMRLGRAAAGGADRRAADDRQLHQRGQGHRARLRRRHARSLEAGDPGAGARRQPDAADRRRPRLHRPPAAAGAPRGRLERRWAVQRR